MSDIFSLESETHVLSGFLKYPRKFFEHSRVSEECFFHETHRTVYSVLRQFHDRKKEIDLIELGDRCRKCGVKSHGKIDISKYLIELSKTLVTEDGTDYFVAELLRFKYLRDVERKGIELQKIAQNSREKDISEVIDGIDDVSSRNISNFFSPQEAPKRVGEDIDWIEERGENPIEFVGYETPFPRYNAYYGGLRDGEIYLFAARGGMGKSSLINGMCVDTAAKYNIPCLILDTEMKRQTNQARLVAGATAAKLSAIETGKWRRRKEWVEPVREAIEKIKNLQYYHMYTGNASAQEFKGIILQWVNSVVGKGNPCIIGLDYFKPDVGANRQAHISETAALGEKIDMMSDLIGEIKCPLVTAVQSNRTHQFENRADNRIYDTTMIADSDRLQRTAAMVGIWTPKTPEDIIEDENLADADDAQERLDQINRARTGQLREGESVEGFQYGTHKLIIPKARHQGDEAPGSHDIVRRPTNADGSNFRFESNYLNFDVDSFTIREKGDLRAWVREHGRRAALTNENAEDGQVL